MSTATKSSGTANDLVSLRESLNLPPKSPVIDVAMWVGQYPFRQIPHSSLDDLRGKLAELRIERAVVSGYECVFAENNLDAYRAWAERLSGDASLEVWPVVRPGMTHGLEKLLDQHRPRGLRLTPNYHGYHLYDRSAERIMNLARERGMIVQVFQRLADERWHYGMKVAGVEQGELEYLTARFGEQPLLLSAMTSYGSIVSRLPQCPNLYLDVSRVRGPQFAIEEMAKKVPTDRLVFGSLWPQQIVEATLWQVTTAKIDDAVRTALLRDNAARLLALAN